MPQQPPVPDASQFRSALGMFATGVTIITARAADGSLVGLTANSFNSVSLSPPLVLWSLARQAGSLPVFSRGSHYAINILAPTRRTWRSASPPATSTALPVSSSAMARAVRRCWTAWPPGSNAPTAASTRKATM